MYVSLSGRERSDSGGSDFVSVMCECGVRVNTLWEKGEEDDGLTHVQSVWCVCECVCR